MKTFRAEIELSPRDLNLTVTAKTAHQAIKQVHLVLNSLGIPDDQIDLVFVSPM